MGYISIFFHKGTDTMNLFGVLKDISTASKKSNRSWFTILLEIFMLRISSGKVGVHEYFAFHLYEKKSLTQKKEFVGYRREGELDKLFNRLSWHALVNDKLTFHALMNYAGFPVTKNYAFYCAGKRHFFGTTHLEDNSDLQVYLENSMKTPTFVKPLCGSCGKGIYRIDSINTESQSVVLAGEGEVSFKNFISMLDDTLIKLGNRGKYGYLFQECLKPHHLIEEKCGSGISGVRLVILFDGETYKIVNSTWKVIFGDNIVDNFVAGLTGNAIADICIETGKVKRVVQGNGLEEIELNELNGFKLPHWQEAKALCLNAAQMFPELKYQHWDIALTDQGPVALECNTSGGLAIVQIPRKEGVDNLVLRNAQSKL